MDFIPSHHPLTPPHVAEDKAVLLRLLRSRRVGPTTFHKLIAEHGTAAAALDALPHVARNAGVSNYQICPEGVVAAELAAGRAFGATLVAQSDAAYPALLSALSDAPPLIWMKGDLSLVERPMLSIVGARNASSLGVRFARTLAADLGREGFGIVSGLARGIDAAAHEGALETGTIAILAGGLDTIYPKENTDIYHRICETGIVMSEQPLGMKPFARHFPMRNRIVSGLSSATIVVEAAARSGSLLTAGNALDQGRDVMAVPGHPFDARASGCNILLRDGAALIRSARDVLDALASAPPAKRVRPTSPASRHIATASPVKIPPVREQTRSLSEHSALHTEILARLSTTALPEDALMRDLDAPKDLISAELLNLELSGRIARKSGGLLSLI
ncbi:DNA-processing protein DprA [Celeribacter marinus]|uniref:DNA-processing protein DprA n=1 Tax=Celeribacter marinus TaxID=1397108 RepID=UPI0031786D93